MKIPYGHQSINNNDIDAVVNTLTSDFLTQGPKVPAFEQAIASYCQTQYAYAVCNATVALHLACLSLGVSKNDIVWTSPNSYVASANCALYCGAKIDFVDISPETYNISLIQLKHKLELAQQLKQLPKVIIVVHFAGLSCEMAEIHQLSLEYGFSLIEDASHAIGGEYQANKIGSCDYSDITIFSFHPVKIITTGEGGMLLTNNKTYAKQIALLRNAGITREASEMTEASHGAWFYQQIALGYNYRMTDIQAALGLSQLTRLDEFILKRKKIASTYLEKLADLNVLLPAQIKNCASSWHLFTIRIASHGSSIKSRRDMIFEALREKGIGVQIHYIPIHTQPYYQQLGFKLDDFPESELYYQETLSLPIFFDMTTDEQEFIIQTLRTLL